MAKAPFEKSKMDRETKGVREGSKREEAFDRKQKAAPKAAPLFAKKFACGGAVKKGGRGR